ncbi:MAG TPA: Asp-tRNA(Asn)/Glu-tRNA(Gln) amidotransferase subunit GatC [Flavobacteriales bacterium]|nr:Asp-tRNA(Asn)/Glu-tRNA(Gln) amidotransferase subunit GatC [Flavobacteriales bacterium]HQW88178.1 Asp-tRNA(Asn)/Glu-tRNA(Gln) amidotransferase subunit GatC [Flavobacteriales bacterium]
MKLDDATLDRIAELARLDFSDPARRAAMLKDMERVLSFVEQLNQVDTRGVEPLVFMTDEENVLREDVALPGVSKQDALRNAPVKDSDYFKVPRVVDKG